MRTDNTVAGIQYNIDILTTLGLGGTHAENHMRIGAPARATTVRARGPYACARAERLLLLLLLRLLLMLMLS